MEQYTTATTTTGEQIVVQTTNGQIQQQVRLSFIQMNEINVCPPSPTSNPAIVKPQVTNAPS